VRILKSLKHPNVIDIYQFFKDDPNTYYVTIEYMKGGELFDRIVKKVGATAGLGPDVVRDAVSRGACSSICFGYTGRVLGFVPRPRMAYYSTAEPAAQSPKDVTTSGFGSPPGGVEQRLS